MKFLRISILTALHVCLIFLHTSCIREEMNACVQYKLNTQAVDEQGNDLTGNGVLEKSEVYLFGEKGFIRMIPWSLQPRQKHRWNISLETIRAKG